MYSWNEELHFGGGKIHFERCQGNGVNFEFSTGFVRDCSFEGFSLPALAVFGPSANPVITDCRICRCAGIGVVARNACAPVFRGVIIDEVESHGFSLSDYSRPYVKDCVVMRIKQLPFAIFNGEAKAGK
jgi:hypothetical protein